MKKSLAVVVTLFSSFQALAAGGGAVTIPLKCGADESYEFRVAGYLSGNPKANLKGAARQHDESTPRKILEIVNPLPTQESTYEKAFDFGNFRYVRNKETSLGWDVYQRATSTSSWVKLDPTPHRQRIYDDQNLFVKIHSKNQLLVLRDGTDDVAKDFYVYTTTDKVTIKGSRETSKAAHYTFGHCKTGQPAGDKAKKEIRAKG